MDVRPDDVRLLLGLRLRALRHGRGAGLKDIAAAAGVSVSYLSEIEKGKKYPKPEKLVALADALGVTFEELVSPREADALEPVRSALRTPFLREFPFRLFGVEPEDVVRLIGEESERGGALVRALAEVGRQYDARVEHFLFAALRAYQQHERNYFPRIEEAVEALMAERRWRGTPPVEENLLQRELENRGVRVEWETLAEHPVLGGFRSVYVPAQRGRGPTLMVNQRLRGEQRAFVLARELGYEVLGLGARALTSSWLKVESFEQVINHFHAGYFAGALLLPRERFLHDLRSYVRRPRWDGDLLLALVRRYRATPEMFFYRLTQLVPGALGLGELYFVRFHNRPGTDRFDLTKVLNLSDAPVPHGLRANWHYCRRWPAMRALRELAERQAHGEDGPVVLAQRSRFVDGGETFFVLTVARRLALSEDTNSAVSIGLRMTTAFKRAARFWADDAVPDLDVDLACERCPIPDCTVRAAPPVALAAREEQERREAALRALGVPL